MPNVNTSQSWVNLPSQAITTTTETVLVTPAAGLISNLPSILFAAGNGLALVTDPDAQTNNPTATTPTYTNASLDGRPFKIRAVFEVTTASTATFIPKLYQVPNSIVTAGTVGTVANLHLVSTGATYTPGAGGTANYLFEATLLWDSVSKDLNGYFSSLANGALTGSVATTQLTALNYPDLNFTFSVTFSAAAANSFVVKEFSFDRL